jgi:hypothetical protein
LLKNAFQYKIKRLSLYVKGYYKKQANIRLFDVVVAKEEMIIPLFFLVVCVDVDEKYFL